MEAKRQLRQACLQMRAKLTSSNRERQSRNVREQVLALVDRERVASVHCYVSFGDELDTHELISELWHRGIRVICPRVERGGELSHHQVKSWQDLKRGAYGVLEPRGENGLEGESMPLILVPGLAFTKKGDRLGFGKGFYDRFLSEQTFRALVIGLAFEEQIMAELPTEIHDCRCHEVFTGVAPV